MVICLVGSRGGIRKNLEGVDFHILRGKLLFLNVLGGSGTYKKWFLELYRDVGNLTDSPPPRFSASAAVTGSTILVFEFRIFLFSFVGHIREPLSHREYDVLE